MKHKTLFKRVKSLAGKKLLILLFMVPVSQYIYAQGSETNQDQPLNVVQDMPTFHGNLIKYLADSLKYPETERKANISGTVYITFVVEKDGSVTEVKVLRGAPNGSGLDAEAVRVVSAMPKWKPGRQNGSPVRVQFNLPIHFELK